MKSVKQARPPWSDVVLVCRKCARKAGAKTFRKDLKHALKSAAGGRSIRVVEAGCFDLCPKRRIVVASEGLLARHRLLVAAPDAVEAAADALASSRADPVIQPGARVEESRRSARLVHGDQMADEDRRRRGFP